MGNTIFDFARQNFGGADLDWDAHVIKPVLVDLNDWGKAVTSASNATPIVIGSTAHGFSNGDIIAVNYVGGNTAANGVFKVANVAANTFELTHRDLGTNVAGNFAYTSGGFAVKISGDLNLSDIPAGARVSTGPALSAKTNTAGVLGASNFAFDDVTGDQAEAIVLYRDTGVEATSRLVLLLLIVAGLPVTPNTGDIQVNWDTGPYKIFKL